MLLCSLLCKFSYTEYKFLKCPMLEEVENAVITSGSLPAYVGHSVVYECSDQHQITPFGETVQRLNCVAGPRWSINLQHCFRKSIKHTV